ncbi:uncharacterized protein LOC144704592 isoform X2 [Wolffia australiana]
MSSEITTSFRPMKASPKMKEEKNAKTHIEEGRSVNGLMPPGRSRSRRERKLQLEKTVDRLRKRLRREENIHRALERAFTRPLGSLPRLPSYLPSKMVELLAEVAVLEEEVVRLEEQVISFWQGLYLEAAHLSSSKKPKSLPAISAAISDRNPPRTATNKKTQAQPQFSRIRARSGIQKQEDHTTGPNKISEQLLRCLIMIFSGSDSGGSTDTSEASQPSISGKEERIFQDPYGIFSEFQPRDVGPYKRFVSVDARLATAGIAASPPALLRRLRFLLRRLGSVDLRRLTHQEKLAFWANVYNSCMMNAFLEKGIPSMPQTVASLMQKATINVGGRVMSAIWIEHFILRLPRSHPSALKTPVYFESIGGFGWPEPLVSFALSCGSWSSPAVRIYTASKVEEELQVAKREYLQAAVGISGGRGNDDCCSCSSRCDGSDGNGSVNGGCNGNGGNGGVMGIPKLLDWYMVDFAKDIDSLADWICLQLPCGLRTEAVNCLEGARSGNNAAVDFIRVIPYDFTFRYLLAT